MLNLDPLPQALMVTFLVTTMLAVGTKTGVSSIGALLAQRRLTLNLLLANFVIVPLLGSLVARSLPLPGPAAAALVLLSCAPGGLGALNFTTRVKGAESQAAAIALLLTFSALLVSPLLIRFALPEAEGIVPPYARIFPLVGLYLLLPLAVGMAFFAVAPDPALKVSKWLGLVSLIAFVAFLVVTASMRKSAVGEIGGLTVVTFLLFIVTSMAIGWFMGGPVAETRQIVAVATGIRNAALCLALIATSPQGYLVVVPLLAFSLLMVPPSMLFTVYRALKARRSARPTAGFK